jgi:hypothetical protein
LSLYDHTNNVALTMQEVSENQLKYIHYVYEGAETVNLNPLRAELTEIDGRSDWYRIYTNPHGIKIKKTLYEVPGTLVYEATLLIPSTLNSNKSELYIINKYYLPTNYRRNDVNKYGDSFEWLNKNPQIELSKFDNLLDELKIKTIRN